MENHCVFTGLPITSPSDGIYDDGDWISWEFILGLNPEDSAQGPKGLVDGDFYLDSLVAIARKYLSETGRYLSIWGELGELYAEAKYGLKRHRAYAEGSDGRIGDDFVEVKTISPEKSEHVVQVKRSGNFSVLIVVKIDSDYNFQAKWIERRHLVKTTGKFAKYKWTHESSTR